MGGGSNFFQGGGGGGGGGSNCLFPIDTNITCDFPGGSEPPAPPLDPHLVCNYRCNYAVKLRITISLELLSSLKPTISVVSSLSSDPVLRHLAESSITTSEIK